MLSPCVLRTPGRLLCAAAILFAWQTSHAQTYSRGQKVSPAYEGWEKNDDGSFSLLFGYMNSNWEEELDVPVGPDNNFQPGTADRGQPTHFFPRRNRFVFRVRVPANFGEQDLVWTLTTHGKTVKAYGSLRQDYFIDNMILTSETGAIGSGVTTPEIRANKPPELEAAGDRIRTVKLGETLTLSAHATDDGVPKNRRRFRPRSDDIKDIRLIPPHYETVSSATGLWVSCFLYRGPGNVTLNPPQAKTWEDTRPGANSQRAPNWQPPPPPADGNWTVQVSFDQPGTYLLRWHATDGALWADEDITVTVTP